MKLSVVIPAYNEEENLKRGALEKVKQYLDNQKYAWEVIVVDDGSKDETRKLVKRFVEKNQGYRLLEEPHRGKAGAVIAGTLAARGEIILFTDMDQATPISQVQKLLPRFKEGYDLVIGSRKGREGAPLVRKLMAAGFTILRTLILRLPYKDTQCGFKAFSKKAAGEIFKRLEVFKEADVVRGPSVFAGFDLEILYLARKLGLRVSEVPVIWRHQGTVRVDPVKDSWEGLRDLVKVRVNALLGKYRLK